MADKPLIIGTGLSGMVGSRFTELFLQDFSFINLDLSQGIDITNQDQVNQVLSQHQSAVVIHLAAFTDVSRAFKEKGDKNAMVYKVNVLGTKNIAQACKKNNHYLIHISTDFIFDGQKDTPYTEEDKPKPIEWYGQTKLWAEEKVKNSGCKSAIVRIAFPFRSYFPTKKDLVRNIIDQLKQNNLHPMFFDQIITPTFIDDICQGLKIFIRKQPQGIYHLTGSTPLSPYDLAEKIKQIFNFKQDIQKGSFKDFLKKDSRPRQQYLKISNQKVKQELNIAMKDIDSALTEMKQQLS